MGSHVDRVFHDLARPGDAARRLDLPPLYSSNDVEQEFCEVRLQGVYALAARQRDHGKNPSWSRVPRLVEKLSENFWKLKRVVTLGAHQALHHPYHQLYTLFVFKCLLPYQRMPRLEV